MNRDLDTASTMTDRPQLTCSSPPSLPCGSSHTSLTRLYSVHHILIGYFLKYILTSTLPIAMVIFLSERWAATSWPPSDHRVAY